VVGKGTEEFSRLDEGDEIEILGPLGNGFPKKGGKVMLIGGGIGIPPMLQLACELDEMEGETKVVLGYQDEVFLDEEFDYFGDLYLATETGRAGTIKGNVMDVIRQEGLQADIIYACGPAPMLSAIKSYAAEKNIECWLSLEEKMACGIGACLSCVCKTKEISPETGVHNKRICKEGPVFLAQEVEL
jgi:dihydroorotate dehydrogenase electron transfer subunit